MPPTDRELMQQALEALEQSETTVPYEGFGMAHREAERKHQASITALRERLAQPEQEPVASVGSLNEFSAMELVRRGFALTDPLYTAPQRREWVGLTDDQVSAIADQHSVEGFELDIMAFARSIEAKLKERNT